MADSAPDLELQGVIIAALKADAAVAALIGLRAYDTIPDEPVFPYVSYGPGDTVDDDADCIDTAIVTIQLDAWSRSVGYPEVRRIADAVRRALHDKDFPLATNALVFLAHRQTRVMRDPDGLTNHAAISLEAYVERRPAP